MRIAVVTPYLGEPLDVLRRCVESVASQGCECTHILVADGRPRTEIDSWPVQHIVLPRSHDDFGDTPRLVGTLSAHSQGFDALCWLDADNWFEPGHIAALLRLALEAHVHVVTATRMLRRGDGSPLGVCTESDGDHFNDTSCYLLMRPAMFVGHAWGFKAHREAVVGDRVVWQNVKARFPDRAHHREATVNYTTRFIHHYTNRNEVPPPDARGIVADANGTLRSISLAELRSAEESHRRRFVPRSSQRVLMSLRRACRLWREIGLEKTK